MVVIRLKSGFEMRVECDKFTTNVSTVTGELTSVSWEGCKNIKPMFFSLGNVDCIYQILEEGEENDA